MANAGVSFFGLSLLNRPKHRGEPFWGSLRGLAGSFK